MGNTYVQKVFFAGLIVAVSVVLVVSCNMVITREGWSKRWGPLVPHRMFPGDCGICHVTDRWDALKKDISFDHENETGYRLVIMGRRARERQAKGQGSRNNAWCADIRQVKHNYRCRRSEGWSCYTYREKILEPV